VSELRTAEPDAAVVYAFFLPPLPAPLPRSDFLLLSEAVEVFTTLLGRRVTMQEQDWLLLRYASPPTPRPEPQDHVGIQEGEVLEKEKEEKAGMKGMVEQSGEEEEEEEGQEEKEGEEQQTHNWPVDVARMLEEAGYPPSARATVEVCSHKHLDTYRLSALLTYDLHTHSLFLDRNESSMANPNPNLDPNPQSRSGLAHSFTDALMSVTVPRVAMTVRLHRMEEALSRLRAEVT
jgi:hypothetical protein